MQKPYLALALATYQQPDFAAGIRNNPPVNQSDLNNARKALADHQPADALEALQQAPAEYATDANYLRAHALFQLAQYPQSAVIFGKLRSSARYGEVAQWYELLAMLPYYERRKAFFMNRLKVIADEDGHIFQTEAKALLGKMVP